MRKRYPDTGNLPPKLRLAAEHGVTSLKQKLLAQIPFTLTRKEVLDRIFYPDDLKLAKEAWNICTAIAHSDYSLGHFELKDGPIFSVYLGYFDDFHSFPIRRERVIVSAVREIFTPTALQLQMVMKKMVEIETVLDYVNKFVTLKAVRQVWPAIMSLMGPDVSLPVSVKARIPSGLGAMLPLIRSSSVTIATGCMLPKPQILGPIEQITIALGESRYKYNYYITR